MDYLNLYLPDGWKFLALGRQGSRGLSFFKLCVWALTTPFRFLILSSNGVQSNSMAE